MAGENNKVVIVTGGSSGIGRCTASALKENGCIVYEFSRRSIPMELSLIHISLAFCSYTGAINRLSPIITSSSTRRAKSSSGKANANGIQYMPSCRAAFMYSL